MMTQKYRCLLLLVVIALLAACQDSPRVYSPPVGPEVMALSQGYALLFSTIDDESQVDQVLMIKGPAPQVAELLKAIGEFSRATKKQLQDFSKAEASLHLDDQGLPVTEMKTRAAISSATSKQILFAGGKDFEFRILLTQHEALNYITHLSASLSKQETQPARKEFLAQVSRQSNALHDRVIIQLKSPYVREQK